MPTVGTISCLWLFYAARDMRVWRYPTFKPMLKIAGVNYAPTKDFPPQHIIDRLVPKDFMLFATNQYLLVDWLKKLNLKMDADPNVSEDELVNEHMKSLPDFPITRKNMNADGGRMRIQYSSTVSLQSLV
ncbi:hypothetical protein DFH11DRAFT_1546478 [Phellopilus nigrolimitatus]|nr:hypothetical protein DFH11DRAFT_1546478 [Phellopilus nigrolimitatus]